MPLGNSPEPSSPSRLFVYLASEAVGIVLRRGPSDWVRLSVWRTDSDEFEHGQWFRARVYERRCDVSPDGSLFVYFARKTASRSFDDIGADSWIAVSRPPWFTALALWPIGSTYCAGGFFGGARSLYLGGPMDAPARGTLPQWLKLASDAPYIDGTPSWTDRTVYFNRLLRDGWKPAPPGSVPGATWERRSTDGARTLVMNVLSDEDFGAYGGPNVVEYAVEDERAGSSRDFGRADWADFDQRGRLVLAREGRLLHYADGELSQIANFNAQTPDTQPSPERACVWPDPA